MTAFHTIAVPHDDILKGRLTMDIFAADLWDVYKNRGNDIYINPDAFFQKTFLTDGLKNILNVVKSRLEGEGGDPVIQLQTPFGGGKTHALIAMFHKAKEWGAKRVVCVGTAMSADDTLWGALEEQLTGKRKQFKGLTSPGRTEEFRNLLSGQGPVLILLDELLEYVTKAAGVQVVDSNLASQTIAFMQELTELVGTLEKVMLVVTLPSSLLEHFDVKAEQLYQQLIRVAGRVEKIYTPVQEHEITSVIRCRLFSEVDVKAAKKEIIEFMDYASRESLLPAGVEPSEYRQRFESSFPFLPDVVDILYQRWGSFPTFQRTRGVLRLLALVIANLKNHNIPYISLADFDLSNQEIRMELIKHIGVEFNGVIAADITGADAGSKKVNASLGKAHQGLHLGERITTTIFMYSFSGGVECGATLTEIKRNSTTLANVSAVVGEAVELLKGTLYYIQNQTGKYFFSNQANINRLLLNRMENIPSQEIIDYEETLLKSRIKGEKLKVYVWRDQSSDIPDSPDLKIIVLSDLNESLMNTLLTEKGSTPRVHRNTMLFLVSQSSERLEFSKLIGKFLAYQRLSGDSTLKLTTEQQKEIKDNLKHLDGDLIEGIRRLYRQLYLPARSGWKEVDLGLPTVGDNKTIDQDVYDRLRGEGEILERIAPLVINEKYLKKHDFVSTSQLYQASINTPGEVRVIGQKAWEDSISEGVQKGLFGLGELKDDQLICLYFKEWSSPSFSDIEILIKSNICESQRVKAEGGITYKPDQVSGGQHAGESPVEPIDIQHPGDLVDIPVSKYQQLNFSFEIPKGKVANLMGVLNFLQSRYNRMKISLIVQEGKLSDQEYEDKVKEAFRQMGIDITP